MKHTAYVGYGDAILCLWLAASFLNPTFLIIHFALVLFIAYFPIWPIVLHDPIVGLTAGSIRTVVVFFFYQALLIMFAVMQCFSLKLRTGVIGEHSFELSDEAFTESTAFNKQVNAWESIVRVSHVAGRLFIQRSGGGWYIIPDRSFPTSHAACQFAGYIRARHRA